MFTLSSDQLQQTSVVINIYDKDPVDSDDFMGEVVIHLASIPGISSGTITRTYSIRPKVTNAWSFFIQLALISSLAI